MSFCLIINTSTVPSLLTLTPDREPGDKASEPARIADTNEYAVWFSWSYTKGYHCAFFFIDVEETKLGADNERKLADFINSNEETKAVFKKRHSVVLTEVTRCSAFAAVFIEAEEDGHLFVGFDPSKSSPARSDDSVQWVNLRAPRGSYKPSYCDDDPQNRLRYTPIYAMRSMQKRSLPISPFGFEPEPAVAKLRQEKLRQDNPGYDKESSVWDSLPPDDSDDDGEKKDEPFKLLATAYEPHDDDNGAGPSRPPHTSGKVSYPSNASSLDAVTNQTFFLAIPRGKTKRCRRC